MLLSLDVVSFTYSETARWHQRMPDHLLSISPPCVTDARATMTYICAPRHPNTPNKTYHNRLQINDIPREAGPIPAPAPTTRTMIPSLIKTTIYTRSLLSNSPASLPQIPTLAELRTRAESIPIPIPSMSSLSLNQSDPPTYSNSPPPVYKKKNWSFSPSQKHARVPVQGTLPGERGVPAMKPSMGYLRDNKGVFGMSFVDILIFKRLASLIRYGSSTARDWRYRRG